jgi:multidrug resistance efflux pump
MGAEGLDPLTIGGGLSILATMIVVIRLAFNRLDKQDAAWMELLSAAERRANTAEKTLSELRRFVHEASVTVEKASISNQEKIDNLGDQLREAKLQIQRLQRGSDVQ